jgi:Tfp pilus assembly protein PilF
LLEKSLALARGLDDKRLIALSLNGFGDLARVQGDEGQAMKFYEESLGLFGEIEDLWWSATVICNTGYVALRQGDLALAAKRFSDSLQFWVL